MTSGKKRKQDGSSTSGSKNKHTITLGTNNLPITKLFRKTDETNDFDSTALTRWLERIMLIIQSDFPHHVPMIDDPTFYDNLEVTLKPKREPRNAALTLAQRRTMKRLYNIRLEAYAKKLDIMHTDKTRIFSLLISAMSESSLTECRGHRDWKLAEDDVKKRYNPARLISVIKLTHRGKPGIGNQEDVIRDFRNAFGKLHQDPKQSLESWYRKVSSYVQVEKNVSPDNRILTDKDYIGVFCEGLNSYYSKVKTEMEKKKFYDKTWWEANIVSLLNAYEHARQLARIEGRDKQPQVDDAITLKVTTKKDKGKSKSTSVAAEDQADVFKASTKGKGKKEPSRNCRHCGHLTWIADHRHWDKDCPLKILLKNKADSDTKPSKKRKNDDKVADTGNQNDYSDADDDSIDHEAAIKNRTKKRRNNK